MSKIIRTELYKLRHNMGFIVLMLVSVALYGGLNYMSETSAEAVSAFTQMGSFSFLIPVFAAVATASIVCDDYQLKTMKNILSSGVSRSSIFFGKYITSMLATFMLLLDAAVTMIICVSFKGFGTHDVVMQQLLINIALQTVVVLIFNTFSFVIASLLKSAKTTIILSAILYMMDGAIFSGLANLTKIKLIDGLSLSVVESDIDHFAMSGNDYLILGGHLLLAVLLLMIACAQFKKAEIK